MIKLSKNGKRLGRPPKDKNSSGTVFVINQQIEIEPVVETDNIPRKLDFGEIECSFVKIPQYAHVISEDMRDGRYSTSPPDVKGLGTKRWVVLAYIKANFNAHRILRKSDTEIIEGCLNYLNNITTKKQASPKYGYLTLVSKEIKFLTKNGEEVAVVELATNERKNDNFWGEGERM